MEKKNKRMLFIGIVLLTTFVLWTVLLCFVDVRAIGPQNSNVGFATLNEYVHRLTGVNTLLYTLTDWLGLVPLGVVFGFALFGLLQWIQRKRLSKVDRSILVLGGFYVVLMAIYVLFETVVINYRPLLIDGSMEASYPSSTTMLVLCVMLTAALQFHSRIKCIVLKRWIISLILAFVAFMIIARLVSGVHWVSDIIGGALLSAGLVATYLAIVRSLEQ